MLPLGVATTPTGSRLMVPSVAEECVSDDGLAPTKRQCSGGHQNSLLDTRHFDDGLVG